MVLSLSNVRGEADTAGSLEIPKRVQPEHLALQRVKRVDQSGSAETKRHVHFNHAHSHDANNAPQVSDPEEAKKLLQFILGKIDQAVLSPIRPTPAPLDTGQGRQDMEPSTPLPLEAKPDLEKLAGIGETIRNRTMSKADSHPGTTIVTAEKKSQFVNVSDDNVLRFRQSKEEDGDDKVRSHGNYKVGKNTDPKYVSEKKHDTELTPGGVETKSTSEIDSKSGRRKHDNVHVNTNDNIHRTTSSDPELRLIPYHDFVQNVAEKKRIREQTQHPARHPSSMDSGGEDEMTTRRRQSLVLIQNVTQEAEMLKSRLKDQTLKLKSYVDVLKNISLIGADEDRKLAARRDYVDKVRAKVNEILNPQKHHGNDLPKSAAASSEHRVKAHFFAKDVPETLRARVDMQGMRKSQGFWEKKGDDIGEEHLQMSSDALQPQDGREQEIRKEDQLNLEDVVKDYGDEDHSFDESAEFNLEEEQIVDLETLTRPEADAVSTEHIIDYHKTRLGERNPVRDHLGAGSVGLTQHELFLMNQLVSGRIHGNILAPPPERCSVKANMKRYRPPEETINEDESLLYRVDLKPEYEAALEGGPMNYLSDYKNPCWLSKITNDRGTLWYDFTERGLTYKRMSYLYEMRLSKGNNWRMRCLPYLYLIGVTKSGTTDLYSRMLGHPEIMRPGHKEPMWWNRLTLGMAESLRKPYRYYVDFFDEAAELIRRRVILKDDKPYHPAITLDATPANLWDYDCWTDIPGNRGLSEPKYTLAHSIRKLVPDARILMILREPTSRLYSQYRMKSHMEPSYTFHKLVMEAIVNFNKCLETRTLRSCAYDYEISKHEFQSPGGVFLRASLYYVFVNDWLSVFPPEQVLVLRTEDYHNDTERSLDRVFRFLGVSQLSPDRLHALSRQHRVNSRTDYTDRSQEPMLPETQRVLDDFFQPYNKMLAKLLHDKRFKWNDVRAKR